MRTVGAHAEERAGGSARRPWTSMRRSPTGSASGSSRRSWRTWPSPARPRQRYHAMETGSRAARAAPGLRPRRERDPPPRAGGRRVRAELSGRSKNVYSIIDKMGRQQKEFEEIYDLMAVRVVVDSVKDCYTPRWRGPSPLEPIPGRFKDYIAMPKGTATSPSTPRDLPYRRPVEVQIRTVEMHHTPSTAWPPTGTTRRARSRCVSTSATAAAPPHGLAEGAARRRGLRRHGEGRHLPGRGLRLHPKATCARSRRAAPPSTSPTESTLRSVTTALGPRSTAGWSPSTTASSTATSWRSSPPRPRTDPHGTGSTS